MDYASLPQRLLEAIEKRPNPRALLYKSGEKWEAMSSQEFLGRIAGLAATLVKLGVGPGDRVGLFSPNRPEWHIADFAINGIGAVNVPVYFNESAERMRYILNHAEAKVLIGAGEIPVQRILENRGELKSVEKLILAGEIPEGRGAGVLSFEEATAQGGAAEIAEYRRRAGEVKSEQLASIIYTSGTTGEPKGVMLTHRNFSSNVSDTQGFETMHANDVALSFLPLSHVYERTVAYGHLFGGVPNAYVEKIEELPEALMEVRPTVMAAVPRVFEKIYANILQKEHSVKGLRLRLYKWAMEVAGQAMPWKAYGNKATLGLRLRYAIADLLVLRKIRAGLGGRLRRITSGGAPLARELAEFFWSVGVPIYQGYGLTETSPIVSNNYEGSNRVGSVGPAIRNCEVRIAEDGEILVKGPLVMQGYYKDAEGTRRVLTEDGWLHTGDVGRLDNDGFLYVTDRKKDLIKTAAGKFVAPQPIENRLKSSPYIVNAAVVGDKRKYVVALIVPNFAQIKAQAKRVGLGFYSDAELTAHPWVRELIQGEIGRLTSNLAQYESIKRFALLDHDFSFDGGQLTFTMKLKRRIIEQRYKEEIEGLYGEEEKEIPHG